MTGEGARIHGGRWNRPGRRVVYCSATRSLAALEILAHMGGVVTPPALVVIEIDIPDAIRPYVPAVIGAGWDDEPPGPASQDVGEAWLAARASPVMEVPSAIVPQESNWLLDPEHPDFRTLLIGSPAPFVLDARLVKAP